MAVTAKLFGLTRLNQWGIATGYPIDWLNDTIKVALLTSSWTPAQDTNQFWSDISANEVVGTGYSAGGATLSGKSKTYTGASNTAAFFATSPSWAGSTITARYAAIYKSTGTAGTSALIGYIDFGTDVSSTAATFTITFDAAGIWTDIEA